MKKDTRKKLNKIKLNMNIKVLSTLTSKDTSFFLNKVIIVLQILKKRNDKKKELLD